MTAGGDYGLRGRGDRSRAAGASWWVVGPFIRIFALERDGAGLKACGLDMLLVPNAVR